ncbi:MAG: hypothetical protein ABL872_09305, partial [Lacibacter sp.]
MMSNAKKTTEQIAKEESKTKLRLTVSFDWNLHPRFNPPESFTNETEVVCGYNRRTHKYLDEYVNPPGYGITLKANTSGQTQFFGRLSYKWEITGIKKDDNTICLLY